ncbi:hypothetical protein [Aporhodopirellula aestuarii]|uniref:Secreted protein n=1 Tax=Aporhodopirellula aestuarii TaxID=2950107 RepID=A0ABT0U5J9_9BACT|nr:hypothetical protein [Aporhodopirellula aestuarii]MCM2371621.1 hypothetical protein [Aporhodopirellula aestuarii]
MTRCFALVAAAIVATFTCSSANAQVFNRFGFYPRPVQTQTHHDDFHSSHHSGSHHDSHVHQASVRELDRLADQLAEVARHLHDDAHQLSQDYEHSHGIEVTVTKLERLQEHMHHILHDAANSRYASSSLIHHVAEDMNSVRSLLLTLYRELQHQGYDGVRHQDYIAINHMRGVITGEALPLLQRMELALYGSTSHHDVHTYQRRSTSRQPVTYQRPRSSTGISLPGFTIRF